LFASIARAAKQQNTAAATFIYIVLKIRPSSATAAAVAAQEGDFPRSFVSIVLKYYHKKM
jgi:hypothetical protein